MKHSQDPRSFVCTQCSFAAGDHGSLRKHIDESHGGQQRELVCPHCDFRSEWAGKMKIHIDAQHSKLRSLRCDYCTYASSQPGTLVVHVRRKHPIEFEEFLAQHARDSSTAAPKCAKRARVEASRGPPATLLRIWEEAAKLPKQGSPTAPALSFDDVLAATRSLVVGEMDFSFSMDVSKVNIVNIQRERSHAQPLVVCTSFLPHSAFVNSSQGVSKKLRKRIHQNTRVLTKRGAIIRFEVDARNIEGTLLRDGDACRAEEGHRGDTAQQVFQSSVPALLAQLNDTFAQDGGVVASPQRTPSLTAQFDRVFFCFPRASLRTGQTEGAADLNAELVDNFFRSAAPLLARNGAIVILLHVSILFGVREDQYVQWGIEEVAKRNGLRRVGVLQYDPKHFGCYQPRARQGRTFKPDEAYFHVFRQPHDDVDSGEAALTGS